MSSDARSERRWRIGFGSGMVLFILLFAVVAGHSLLEKVTGLAVLVLLLLNGWLPRSKDDDKPAHTFLQRAFQGGPVMKASAVILWIACAGLAAKGTSTLVARNTVRTYEGQILADGRPAAYATVMLQHRGKVLRQTMADAQGRFRFEGVKRSILNSDSTRVVYRDRAAVGSAVTARLNASPVTLHLPLTNTPFRVSYFDIDGIAIDLLLAGGVDSLMADMLDTQPNVLSTPVFQMLTDLRRRFRGGEFMFELRGRARGRKIRVPEEDIGRYSEMERLAATVDAAWFDWSVSPQEFSSMFRPQSSWRLDLLSDPKDLIWHHTSPGESPQTTDESYRAFRFWRYATASDVQRVWRDVQREEDDFDDPQRKAWLNFVRHVIRGGLPPDFLLYTIECLCNAEPHDTCLEGGMVRGLQGRTLRVRVAVLENVTSQAVRVDSFVFRTTNGPLRSEQADSAATARQPVQRARWFPTSVLKPGESMLVPLALSFDAVQEDSVDMDPYTYSNDPELAGMDTNEPPAEDGWGQLLAKFPRYQFPVDGPNVTVPAAQLMEMARRSTRRPFHVESYLYGPSLVLDSITADGTVYPVRKAERQQVSARGLVWSRGATCPHVYVWSEATGTWIYHGAILVSRVSQWKQGVQRRPLHGFTGRVRIAEEEPEVSYIDQVVLRVTLADGTEQLLPAQHDLRARDGEYLVLRPGQMVDLSFDPPSPRAVRVELEAAGYYVPLRGAELSRYRAAR